MESNGVVALAMPARVSFLWLLMSLMLVSALLTRDGLAQTTASKPHPGASAGAPQAKAPPDQPQSAEAPGVRTSAVASGDFIVSQLGHAVGTASFQMRPAGNGIDSTSVVHVSMKGLEYALSKTERLDAKDEIAHEQLSATVNGSAVNVTGKPDAAQFLLNISANGRSTTTRLAAHGGAVFLPDFDPGGLQTLLTVAAAQNGRDLWAILPKQAGSVQAVELATYPDEHGTLDGKAISVHHLVATIAGTETDLFADDGNVLLQAELPQEGFTLVRKGFVLTPPRKPVQPAVQP